MEFNISLLDQNKQEFTALFLKNHGHHVNAAGIIIESIQVTSPTVRYEYVDNSLKIYGREKVHYYRALHLFLQETSTYQSGQLNREECAEFQETGILLDCSRNGAMTIEQIKEFIRICAACGILQLYLYMEDVYEIPDNPYFGAFRGRYTYSELRELDAYGLCLGVELIPAIQTLAHLHSYLKWRNTRNVQDTADILLVGEAKTKELVRQMIENAARPFTSKKIHVGMDEAALLGLGTYIRIHGYQERYGIMMEHLTLVYGICQELGLSCMIWSDMFFRLKSPTGGYYDLSEDTEFDLPKPIPGNLTLVYWDYYQQQKEDYDRIIRLHKKLSNRICYAGGGWTWNGLSPNYSKARKTLSEGLSSCKAQNIDHVICTFWFDNGTETPVETAVYSVVYFAQQCYRKVEDAKMSRQRVTMCQENVELETINQENVELETINQENIESETMNRWLVQLTGYTKEEFELLDALDTPPGVFLNNRNADNPSKYLFYQDVLVGLFDGQIAGLPLEEYYSSLNEKLGLVAKRNVRMDDVFAYYHILAELLSKKALLGVNLRRAYQHGHKQEMHLLTKQLEECIPLAHKLRETRKHLWFSECRPFGYEILDIRYGGVETRLVSALERINSYLDGTMSCIEELEEAMVIFDEDFEHPEHRHCMGGFWQNMISAGNIAGV